MDKSGKFSSIGKVLDFNFNLISLSNEILFLEDHRFTFHWNITLPGNVHRYQLLSLRVISSLKYMYYHFILEITSGMISPIKYNLPIKDTSNFNIFILPLINVFSTLFKILWPDDFRLPRKPSNTEENPGLIKTFKLNWFIIFRGAIHQDNDEFLF